MPFDQENAKIENTLALFVAILYDYKINALDVQKLEKMGNAYETIKGFTALLGKLSESRQHLPKLIQCGYLANEQDGQYPLTISEHIASQIRKVAKKEKPQKYLLVEYLVTIYRHLEQLDLKSLVPAKEDNKKQIQSIDEFFLSFFTCLNQNGTYLLDEDVFYKQFGFSFYDEPKLQAFLQDTFNRSFPKVDIVHLFYSFLQLPSKKGKINETVLQRKKVPGLAFYIHSGEIGQEFFRDLDDQDIEKLETIVQIYQQHSLHKKA